MVRRHKLLFGIGALLVVAGMAVRWYVAPTLIRFPLNLNETAHYSGIATSYVDQATSLPLAQPLKQPLTLDRNVKVVSGSHSQAIVDESVTITVGTQTTHEQYRYTIDRRSMRLLAGPSSYAFGNPANVMHPAGDYRINWPLGTTASGHYPSYISEADVAVPLTLVRGKHFHTDAGVSVIDFGSKVTTPVAPYYVNYLKSQGLPTELTAAQLQPQLLAQGIDVAKALADVGPQLTPDESQVVANLLSNPVPLKYFYMLDGTISVEPRTGALVDVHSQVEGVAVQPDLSGTTALQALLDKYSSIPSVKAASDGLAKLAAAGPTLAENFQYAQTPASSRHLGNVAKHQIRLMDLLQLWLPLTLVVVGAGLLLAGGWAGLRRRGGTGDQPDTSGPVPSEPPAEKEPVPSGHLVRG